MTDYVEHVELSLFPKKARDAEQLNRIEATLVNIESRLTDLQLEMSEIYNALAVVLQDHEAAE